MPNIAVTNYCNLKCPYCFADDMIQEKTVSISMDDYCKILEFVSRTPNNHVGIIGGEPCLHPQFDEIIKETNKYCRECNTDATLFTNGIELDKYIPLLGERIGILINCNDPKYQKEELFQKQRACLDHLYELSWFNDGHGGSKANCGCNVHPGQDTYDFIWEIVERYKLDHIRCSVVSPGGCYKSMRTDKEGYYNKMKPIFINFVKEAAKHHCKLNMDCGHIPMCYFNREEKELLEANCMNLYSEWCNPVIDITPDFRATACFGSYDPVDIRDFNNIMELDRYLLLTKNAPKAEANCTGRCTTCKKHDLKQCQGGCLGFADVEEE